MNIGHLSFKTKKQASEHFKTILNHYSFARPVVHQEHHQDLLALLERHPERDLKIGCGVKRFTVQPSKYGHRKFVLHRNDGTESDFSYLCALKGKPPSFKELFAVCARRSIVDDIIQFRDDYFAGGPNKCQATGRTIYSHESNVDHHPVPFKEIMARFLAAYPCGEEVISPPSDNQESPDFVCLETAQRFREFHRQFDLRIVHKDVPH